MNAQFVVSLTIFIIIFVYIICKTSHKYLENFYNNNIVFDDIYCLMVTGKDDVRYKFAQIAVKNFKLQTFPNKYLIIINEGDKNISSIDERNILEIHIDKKKMSLGELRNISLEFVPMNAIWTTWDDDDWRSNDYLNILYKQLKSTKSDIIMFQNRLEHNFNTNYTWISRLNSGFILFFKYKKWYDKFDDVDYNEELTLKKYILKNSKYYVFNNIPNIYLRFVHLNNTSVYVNPQKNKINDTIKNIDYKEYDASLSNKQYVKHIVKKYYRDIN